MALVKERASAKFDETVEIALNLGVDPKHADQMVRGVVNLPNGTGRTLKVAVFARGAKADEARKAGADIVGAEDLVATVQGGTIDFDRCIATPDMMPLVGRLGKVLGPRGLMPNPKVGTVTMDVTAAVKASKGGAVEFRVEKAGIIQGSVGKASFGDEQLVQNISRLRRCGDQGQAGRRQGHLHAAHRDLLDHGSRRQSRPIQRRGRSPRVRRGLLIKTAETIKCRLASGILTDRKSLRSWRSAASETHFKEISRCFSAFTERSWGDENGMAGRPGYPRVLPGHVLSETVGAQDEPRFSERLILHRPTRFRRLEQWMPP